MFHKTSSKIYVPDYDKLLVSISNHGNGALGLWYANEDKEWAGGFGSNVYEFGIKNPKPYNMTVTELRGLGRNGLVDEFTRYRNMLMKENFNYIKIIESDGRCDMGVVLDFNAIVKWTFVRSES
jgi:hypothetical protein